MAEARHQILMAEGQVVAHLDLDGALRVAKHRDGLVVVGGPLQLGLEMEEGLLDGQAPPEARRQTPTRQVYPAGEHRHLRDRFTVLHR